MPWVAVSDAGIGMSLNILGSEIAISGSEIFTVGGSQSTGWTMDFNDYAERLYRVVVTEYQQSGGSAFIQARMTAGPTIVSNQALDGSWSPSPVEFTAAALTYAPAFGAEVALPADYRFTIEIWVEEPAGDTSYNCECDDDYPRTTLGDMRKRLLRRLGFAAQANNPPPGMADLLDDFIRQAQEMLFRRYSVFRRERWFTWDLIPGTRFYDLDANADECTKRLEPRMITWAGISQGDDSWRPLVCGIDPVMYSSRGPGIPSHYEIRQCIELWPAPSDATWKLRIKGQFGLLPLIAATDSTSIDPEAIFLLALANAKAHYGQPDAGNYASQLQAYVRDLVRGSHMTRRYFPGEASRINAVRPIPVGGWPESTP